MLDSGYFSMQKRKKVSEDLVHCEKDLVDILRSLFRQETSSSSEWVFVCQLTLCRRLHRDCDKNQWGHKINRV
jgi:hypothetical protein